MSHPEYWNNGMTGSWTGITLIEFGEASACSGCEAKGQESFVSYLRSFVPQDKFSDPQECPVSGDKPTPQGERP